MIKLNNIPKLFKNKHANICVTNTLIAIIDL